MRFKIKGKKEFMDLSRHIKEDASYNVSIAEATVSETGFTNKQLEQLAALLAPIKQDIVEIKQDIVEIKQRLTKVEQDVADIKSLPTIKRELKLQKTK